MRVLIHTQVGDVHAKVVQRALTTLGHEAVLWYGADLPQQATASVAIDPGGEVNLMLSGPDGPLHGPFDRVWLRRRSRPVLPEDMHAGDRTFSALEWRQMGQGIALHLAPDAFWVNPHDAAGRAESKAWQLSHACAAGMRVPPTLFSSDPTQIRAFLRSHGPAIYKPFVTPVWRTGDAVSLLYTASLSEDDLPEDEVLRLCPGIFQPRIDKSYELRVTIVGRHMVAVRLNSQDRELTRTDWRAGIGSIEMTPAVVPPELERRCFALMERLGLVFGCLDFIVTSAGEHVFLELNQMGQFLWLEHEMPELALLDAFCALLIAGRSDFTWDRRNPRVRFSDLRDEGREALIDLPHVTHEQTNHHADLDY